MGRRIISHILKAQMFIYTLCCAVVTKDNIALIVGDGLPLEGQLVWYKRDLICTVGVTLINGDV